MTDAQETRTVELTRVFEAPIDLRQAPDPAAVGRLGEAAGGDGAAELLEGTAGPRAWSSRGTVSANAIVRPGDGGATRRRPSSLPTPSRKSSPSSKTRARKKRSKSA